MKKLLATITASLYFAFSCGVMVNLHYCMGEVDSVQIYAGSDDICNNCGMHIDEAMGCCHDEVAIAVLDDERQISTADYQIDGLKMPVSVPDAYLQVPFSNFKNSEPFSGHSPPLVLYQDVYLVNSVFLI